MSYIKWTNELLEYYDKYGKALFKVSPYYQNQKGVRNANLDFETDEKLDKDISATEFNELVKTITHNGLSKIKLYGFQESILYNVETYRFVSILTSRQMGISTIMSQSALKYACTNKNKTIVLFTNNSRQGRYFLDIFFTMYLTMPFHLKPGVISRTVNSIIFDNGCAILAKSTVPPDLNELKYDYLLVQDAAYINNKNLSDLIIHVGSRKKSKIVMWSINNGFEYFMKTYLDGKDGKNAFYTMRVNWWQVPGRDEQWKMNQIKILGSEEDFDNQYGNVFNSNDIDK